MSGTEDLEKQERERRDGRTAALQHWETELRALAQQLEDEGHQNGWVVRYRYLGEPRQLTAMVTIDGSVFACFSRDEKGIIGVVEGGEPHLFADRYTAFNAAKKQEREWRDKRTATLQHWETELRALAQQLEDEGHQNGWVVRYRYLGEPRQLTAMVTIDGSVFACFSRDEKGIIGVVEGGEPQLFADRYTAFNAAVKPRIARQKFK